MGEHLNGLEQLGGHVAGSLEQARAESPAAARVRSRLLRGEARAPEPPVRIRRGAVLGALALAASVLLVMFAAWRGSSAHAALTFVVGDGAGGSAGAERGVVGAFLAAPAGHELPLSFSDGTRVQIAAGARARVAEVSSRGARVLVESGVVHANVIHRHDTRWLVDAGPFEVKVTGTRFDVGWEPGEEAIVVTLHEGSVVVTGCALAEGQRVSAGQQLRASCKSGLSTLGAAGAPSGVTGVTSTTDTTDTTGTPAAKAGSGAEPAPTAAASLPDAPDAPDAPACPLPLRLGSPRCETCLSALCCEKVYACTDDPACHTVLSCARACLLDTGADSAAPCIEQCKKDTPGGATKYEAFDGCIAAPPPTGCAYECS